MPALGWVDQADVLSDLGLVDADDRVPRCIASAEDHVSHWRGDITDWPAVKQNAPGVYEAGVGVACLLWQSNVTPEGFAGFEDAGGTMAPYGVDHSKWWQLRKLARAGRPQAR